MDQIKNNCVCEGVEEEKKKKKGGGGRTSNGRWMCE
jgi:hypothetical protein